MRFVFPAAALPEQPAKSAVIVKVAPPLVAVKSKGEHVPDRGKLPSPPRAPCQVLGG